jgi:hypothetical protein
MNYTSRNIAWKGNATNSIVPTNSRPFTNDDKALTTMPRTQGKANPIKHWRKQLQPYYPTKSSKQVSIEQINAPNSVVYIHDQQHDCGTNNYQLLKENITLLNECLGIKYVYDDDSNRVSCIGGSHNVKRSGSTNMKKGYYSNHAKYLQAKCKSYDQNSTLGNKVDETTFLSTTCENTKCNKPVIYKPSNKSFSTQGSVSASANILRKKNMALTNNYNSLKSAYGASYMKAIPYYPGSTGYEIKYLKGEMNNSLDCEQTNHVCKK